MPRHNAIEFPRGAFSELNINFGKTFLVLLVLKKGESILYESANVRLFNIIDF